MNDLFKDFLYQVGDKVQARSSQGQIAARMWMDNDGEPYKVYRLTTGQEFVESELKLEKGDGLIGGTTSRELGPPDVRNTRKAHRPRSGQVE